ncbi:dihydroorotase [Beggiatoa alba]|nr:dihydroorotase [Beggiatoa alba]
MKILIQQGHVIDPLNNIDAVKNICIADGKIISIADKTDDFSADQVIDANNQTVMPGIVDICARLREPGLEHKGTIASETAAAAAAGITTICVPPDTDPCIDSTAVAELIYQRSQAAAKCHVVTQAALTHGLNGEHLSEMAILKAQANCVGVSNGLKPVKSILVMRRAMEYAASCDMTIFLHAEDPGLANHGCAHEGVVSTRLGLAAIPESAETSAVSRDLMLIEQTGVRAHFSHISSLHALKMIAQAKQQGLPVSVDVSMHHLHLTDLDIGFFDSNCHVIPPLRSQRDKQGLRQGLQQNNIDVLCSDHQPHCADAKLAPFSATEPGISALETLLSLGLRLVNENVIDLKTLVQKLTLEPAKILGIAAGHLSLNSAADICIFNPATHWTVKPEQFISAGHNTPFSGWELQGKVSHTLLDGRIVYQSN